MTMIATAEPIPKRPPARGHARKADVPDVRLVEAQTVRGGTVLIALSRSDPGKAYVLELGDQGQPICPCPAFSFRGKCSHVAALLFGPPPAKSRIQVEL